MIKLLLPITKNKYLFKSEFIPDIADEMKAHIDKKTRDCITLAKNRKNFASVGIPEYRNITNIIKKEKEFSKDIKKMLESYDFHQVSFFCSFTPDADCRFSSARFIIELFAEQNAVMVNERPIAYTLFPEKIEDVITCKREVNLGFDLGVKMNIVDMKGSGSSTTTSDYVVYQPRLYYSGLRESIFSWNFKSTESNEIAGAINGLLAIIRTPKNTRLKGKFNIKAKAEIMKFTFNLKRRKEAENLVNTEYYLSEL